MKNNNRLLDIKAVKFSLLFLVFTFTSIALVDMFLLDHKVETVHITKVTKNKGRTLGIQYLQAGALKHERLARANLYFKEGHTYKLYRTNNLGWLQGYSSDENKVYFFSAKLNAFIVSLCFVLAAARLLKKTKWTDGLFELSLPLLLLLLLSK